MSIEMQERFTWVGSGDGTYHVTDSWTDEAVVDKLNEAQAKKLASWLNGGMPGTVKIYYFGKTTDQYGMPDPYHAYVIFVGPWETADSGVASIVTFSGTVPGLRQNHLDLKGGIKGALAQAEAHLDSLPAHKGLTKRRV